MKLLLSAILVCGIFAMTVLSSEAEENREMDKRYLAALAKNGRLPKFANAQKKDQESVQTSEKDDSDEDYMKDNLLEDKRHVGAFLKLHGKPNFARSSFSDSNRDDKRNIASMARLGRLNSIRYARFQPGGKRMSSEEMSNNDEDNTINLFEDPDCIETEDIDNGGDDRPIWIQKKRYVAALARSGRLPIWHSQRMWWGGKRDDSRPSWSSSQIAGNRGENLLDEMPYVAAKNKRCKKVYDYQMDKRNVASLARNGKLPFRPNA